ncbi:olfactory receptor 1038-like [Tachyglossus aculeatus]|uniref:olfactory receptor 1038-like n=1 Tax=Tachyglossus aculeatus TaxID=9261 RepID=UPI0018F5AB50|nr:olfactory receptor 1038-like [Tachyglossus aculeatus]
MSNLKLVTGKDLKMILQFPARILQPSTILFPSHLSLVNLGYSSAVTPHMLSDFLRKAQNLCPLVIGCYLMGFVNATTQTILTFRLSFSDSTVINHFFCDLLPLLELSCSNTHGNETVLLLFAVFLGMFTSVEIFHSYIFIFATILRIGSAEGRCKAFSICTSHLAAVTIFYGTTVFMYVRPSSSYSLDSDKVTSVFYTVVIPMLNIMIYSLRNKEMKNAMSRCIYQGYGIS